MAALLIKLINLESIKINILLSLNYCIFIKIKLNKRITNSFIYIYAIHFNLKIEEKMFLTFKHEYLLKFLRAKEFD